ncbi:MAG: glycogen/starch/alpha-glucan phosphorylase [Tissierellia bacterium]|nr:glycogen/starch/alpha-glucan phosphorylase [Tissierellia bacterium]
MREDFYLEDKIEENLFETFAKDMSLARDGEIYTSLAKTIRMLIGKIWNETVKKSRDESVLYLLCFEYSLGNILLTNAAKLGILDEVKTVLKRHGRSFEDIQKNDFEFALGFGDLGTLTGASLDYLANNNQNVYAYGLRYRKGMLKQEIINGSQVEKPDDWKVNNNPWEHEKEFSHFVDFKNNKIKAIPYDIPILGKDSMRVNTLRLWKSESVHDIDFMKFSEGRIQEAYKEINEANAIVEFLYPKEDTHNGRKLRLSQEYFFASACVQDILKKHKKYKNNDITKLSESVKIQICDIHPALTIVVFIKALMEKYELSFEASFELARNVFIFMNTSFLPENFEVWSMDLISEVCPQLINTIRLIDAKLKMELNDEKFINRETLTIVRNESVNLFNIAYYVSGKIKFLSGDHIDILRTKYFPNHYAYYMDKCEVVTLGFDGKQYISEINEKLVNAIENKDVDLLDKIKFENKKNLIEKFDLKGIVNPKSIFISKVGVFHEYKRQLLSALSILMLYYKLKQNANMDIPERTYFFGGKSYPNYYMAKEMIKFINALAKLINNDLTIKNKIKIVFIENYNMTKSNLLIPATEVYEEVSNIPLEYTDISLIRFIINGSIILAGENSLVREHKNIINNKYIFESVGDDYIFNINDYLTKHPIINEMFNHLKNLPKELFPYDVNIIYNSLFYFNDTHNVLRDLFSHYEMSERICQYYYQRSKWNEEIMDNIIRGITSTKNYF